MKISIITITCRKDAALKEMAATIKANAKANKDVELEWVVVDEIDRKVDCDVHCKPEASKVRPGPAMAVARNTGLKAASGDYVCFLDDNRIVTAGWLAMVKELAEAGFGYRPALVRAPSAPSFVTPKDGVVNQWIGPTLKSFPTKATNVSSCFGAPMAAFKKIGGFDEAFDGESKFGGQECALRLERAGVAFYGSKRASVVLLHRGKDDETEIVTPPTNTNDAKWNGLVGDGERIHPIQSILTPVVEESASAVDSGNEPAPTRPEPTRSRGGIAATNSSDAGDSVDPPPVNHVLAQGTRESEVVTAPAKNTDELDTAPGKPAKKKVKVTGKAKKTAKKK